MEIWKDVLGYEGRYEVSNYGRLRSWMKPKSGRRLTPRNLKPSLSKDGYYRFHLVLDGKLKGHLAHRLVMSAHVGESVLEVNHLDGNKLNNCLSNLEYCTRSENLRHAADVLGKPMGNRGRKGELNGRAKLTVDKVREIRQLQARGMSQDEIARLFGVRQSTISDIVLGKNW